MLYKEKCHCLIINCLKQLLISSEFCRSKIWVRYGWVFCSGSSWILIWKLWGKYPLPNLTEDSQRIQVLMIIELRSTFPCRLSTKGCFQLLEATQGHSLLQEVTHIPSHVASFVFKARHEESPLCLFLITPFIGGQTNQLIQHSTGT